MQRKAAKLFGLVLAGAAAISVLRRLLGGSGGGDDSGPAPEAPKLIPVPDQDPGPAASVEAPALVGAQSWVAPVEEDCPAGYPIKVNERSGIYHVPGGLSYARTNPTRCYPSEEAAQADGFRRAKR